MCPKILYPQISKDLVGILTSLPCLFIGRNLSVQSVGSLSDNTSMTSVLKAVVHTGLQAWISSAQPADSAEVITMAVAVRRAGLRSSHIN